jgi:Tfp pilus assembly protein PilV
MKYGQSLVEVLVAVAVAAVVLVALAGIGTKATSNSGLSSRQSQATAYAQQAMNIFKFLRQEWVQLQTYPSGNYCFNGTSVFAGTWCQISNTEYSSMVTVNRPGAGVGTPEPIGVTVRVRWYEGKGGSNSVCGAGYLCSVLTNTFVRY